MLCIPIICAIFLLILPETHSYSSNLISSWRCKKPYKVGAMIMGSSAVLSNVYSLVISRNGTLLQNGDVYSSSETLQVSISDPTLVQYAMETDYGIFDSTNNRVKLQIGCSSKRFYDESNNIISVDLVMPDDGSNDVKVWVGWAKGIISYSLFKFPYISK